MSRLERAPWPQFSRRVSLERPLPSLFWGSGDDFRKFSSDKSTGFPA